MAKVILWLLLLTSISLGQQINPTRLTSWKNSWIQNSIELSSTNILVTGVTYTFYINPSTTLTNGFVEVTFPSSMTLGAFGCDTTLHSTCTASVAGQVVTLTNINITAGVDSKIGITGVTNDGTVGGHGPFAILTRHYQNGQIQDINKVFGSIGLAATANTMTTLITDLVGTIDRSTGATNNVLQLQFEMSLDTWKHDIFKITGDQYWTFGNDLSCTSATYSGTINHINGTRSDDPHNLDCGVSQKTTSTTQQNVYVYGLANDLDISIGNDYKYGELRFGPITNPSVDYADTTYVWTVEKIRFQTKTVLESRSTSTGPATSPAVISTVYYTPTWSEFGDGWTIGTMQQFMDVSVTTINPIPANGEMIVTFSDVVNGTPWGGNTDKCYYREYVTETVGGITYTAACVATGTNTVTLTALPSFLANSTLRFRIYVDFQTVGQQVATINSIISYATTGGLQIDASTSTLGAFNLSGTNDAVQLTNFEVLFATDSSTTTNAGSAGGEAGGYTYYLKIHWQPSVDTASGTTVKVHCPLTTTAVSDNEIYIDTDAGFAGLYRENSADLSTGTSAMDGTGTNLPLATVTGGSDGNMGTIEWTLDATILNFPTAAQTQTVGLYRTTGETMGWPQVASNASTAYECRILVDHPNTATHSEMRGSFKFEISDRAITPTHGPYTCNDSDNGMIQLTTFQLDKTEIPVDSDDKTYYVEIEYDMDNGSPQKNQKDKFNSGLSDGDTFPVKCEGQMTTPDLVATLVDNTTDDAIRLSNFGVVNTATAINCYYPIGENAANGNPISTIGVTLRIYYIEDGDTRTKNVYYTDTRDATTNTLQANDWGNLAITSGNNHTNGSAVSDFYFTVLSQASAGVGNRIQATFPAGYTFEGYNMHNFASPNTYRYVNVRTFSSTTRTFAYPSISGEIAHTALSNSAQTTLHLNYVKSPLGAKTGNVFLYQGTAGGQCNNNNSAGLSLTTVTGSVYVKTISPRTLKGRGPNSVDESVTTSFTTQHGVPEGGNIVFTVHSDWQATSGSLCNVTGLTDQTAITTLVTCTPSGNTFTITNFADFQNLNTLITVQITRLLPPINTTSSVSKDFIATIVTSDGTNQIDTYAAQASEQILMTPNESSGVSTIIDKALYPDTAAVSVVDSYLKFSMATEIPEGGSISIEMPIAKILADSDNKDSCWFSLKYSACTSTTGSTNKVTVTLAEVYFSGTELELWLDAAYSAPGDTTTTTSGVRIGSEWFGIELDQDTTTYKASQKYTALTELTESITGSADTDFLIMDPTNAGEYADYTFKLYTTQDYLATDYLKITFPKDFDPYIGKSSVWFDDEPNTYRIDCESSYLGVPLFCEVEHWTVTIKGVNAVAATDAFEVKIKDVLNPAQGATGQFKIAHLDSLGAYKAFNHQFGNVTPTIPAKNIVVRSITQSSTETFETEQSYTFQLYLDGQVDTNKELKVLFPPQFDLYINQGVTEFACTNTWIDETSTTTGTTTYNSGSTCSTTGNWISKGTRSEAFFFTADHLMTWTISDLTNPEWGLTRVSRSFMDWDNEDSDIWEIQDVYNSNFQFFVYDTTASLLNYSLRSYGQLSAAYTGSSSNRLNLAVNGYDPNLQTNKITVYPGTQSNDIAITTVSINEPMLAQRVTLTPTTNERTPDGGLLKYESYVHEFAMFLEQTSINFKITADLNITKGLYYIDWAVDELPQSGYTERYNPPPKTLVEIPALTEKKYHVSVAQLVYAVPHGETSVPIIVSIPNAPASDIKVSLSVVQGDNVGILLTPSELEFGPGETEKSFIITVEASYNMSTIRSQNLSLSLSGTDSVVYSIDSTYTFSITESTNINSDGVADWGIGTCTKTSCQLNPTVGQIGTLYYQFMVEGATCPTVADLKADIADSTNSNLEKQKDYHNGVNTSPQSGESWADFQYRTYKAHRLDYWVGSYSMYALSNVANINPTWLWAETNYMICGIVENVYSNISSFSTGKFTTADMAEPQFWSLTVTDYLEEAWQTKINTAAAWYQGVNPLRNTYKERIQNVSRRLQTLEVTSTSFYYILATDRNAEDPDPSDLAYINPKFYDDIDADLTEFLNTVMYVQNERLLSRITPEWVNVPTPFETGADYISFTANIATKGSICCTAVAGTVATADLPSPEQAFLGIDGTNKAAAGTKCVDTVGENLETVKVEGLAADTLHTVFCIAMDDFNLWPTFMTYSEFLPMQGTEATTAQAIVVDTEDADDYAWVITVAGILLAFN